MSEKLSNLSRVIFDKMAGEFFIGNDVAYDGEVIIQQYVQSEPSDTWRIDLNIDGEFLQAFVFLDNGDGTYSLGTPESLEQTELDELVITFSSQVIGLVNVLLTTETRDLLVVTPTPTVTPTSTLTPTPTTTMTPGASATPTVTPTVTPTFTPTSTVTPTVTPGNTVTPTVTLTSAVTVTPTLTITPTSTITPTVTPTYTATAVVTTTPTPTVTPTFTATATVTPTFTPTMTVTPTPSPSGIVLSQGYFAAGYTGTPEAVPTLSTRIDRFPFSSPFAVATNIGDLSVATAEMGGHSSVTDGYTSGGTTGYSNPVTRISTTAVRRFPFSVTPATSTTVGDLNTARWQQGGIEDSTQGYAVAGLGDPGGFSTISTVERFPFSAPFVTATALGDLTNSVPNALGYGAAVKNATTTGYFAVGFNATAPNTRIMAFPLIAPFTVGTTVGDLAAARSFAAGVQSSTRGYIAGGSNPPSTPITAVTSFPFSVPFVTTTNAGALSPTIGFKGIAGLQSNNSAYYSGGSPAINIIQRFPFSTPFATATDIGDLSLARHASAALES